MQRIVVLNPKGGSGKTTIAINLASYYAFRKQTPLLLDLDPQGSSMRWARKRHPNQGPVHAVSPFSRDNRTTRSFQLRAPTGTTHVVVDTAAAVEAHEMPDLTRAADKILVPVLPSDIDIHACSRCIQSLLLVAKIRREDNRLGVIANRVRRTTLMYQSLIRFLHTLGVPIVATIRDSQNYVRAAEQGLGIHEMKTWVAREDVAQWEPLITWIDTPAGTPVPTLSPETTDAAPPAAVGSDPGSAEDCAAGAAEPAEDYVAEEDSPTETVSG